MAEPTRSIDLHDAGPMRALAHPLRLRILGIRLERRRCPPDPRRVPRAQRRARGTAREVVGLRPHAQTRHPPGALDHPRLPPERAMSAPVADAATESTETDAPRRRLPI